MVRNKIINTEVVIDFVFFKETEDRWLSGHKPSVYYLYYLYF